MRRTTLRRPTIRAVVVASLVSLAGLWLLSASLRRSSSTTTMTTGTTATRLSVEGGGGRSGASPPAAGRLAPPTIPEPKPIPLERIGIDPNTGELGLTDSQLRSFVSRGFLALDPGPEYGPSFHSSVASTARKQLESISGPVAGSNNLAALIPNATRLVTESKAVRAAVDAILGKGAILHGHRHLHSSRTTDQCWHKDSYFGSRRPRDHRPRWAMAMYYPVRVTLDMGPTFVQPYSQYSTVDTSSIKTYGEDRLGTSRPELRRSFSYGSPDYASRLRNLDEDASEIWPGEATDDARRRGVPLVVPAGAVVLIHYDLLHRGSARLADDAPWRPMFKWQFLRVREPSVAERRDGGKGGVEGAGAPDGRWSEFLTEAGSPSSSWPSPWPPAPPGDTASLVPVWEDVYSYLTGASVAGNDAADVIRGGAVPDVAPSSSRDVLLDGASTEARRLGAAYSLGVSARSGDDKNDALRALLDAATSPEHPERVRRAAMRGLGIAGIAAVPALTDAVERELKALRGRPSPTMRFLVAALAEAVSSATTTPAAAARTDVRPSVEGATDVLARVVRSSPENVGDALDDALDSTRSSAAEGLGRALSVHAFSSSSSSPSLSKESASRAVSALVDALDDAAPGRSLLHGYFGGDGEDAVGAGDKRALPQSAALGLLLVARAVADSKNVAPKGGRDRDEVASVLASRLRRVVDDAVPDRYVSSYAFEGLRALSEADEEVRSWLMDRLLAARWCPRTSDSSQY